MSKGSRILTADRIGIALVIISLIGMRMGIFSMGLLGLGVFGPPLLREFGLMRDDDDFTRGVMHRAGFHALLPVVALLTADRIMANYHESLPAAWGQHDLYFDLEFLIQLALVVYVVSFVVQYWGARAGVARVFVGVAVIAVLQILGAHLTHSGAVTAMVAWSTAIIAAVLCSLGWFASRKPRAAGVVLLVLCAAALVGFGFDIAGADQRPEYVRDNGLVWAVAMAMVWAIVLFGGMGVALLRDPE